MAFVHQIKIRNYDGEIDRVSVEDLERRCEVGPKEHVFLYTDTMGDPICRIRNTPMYNMLVAELNNEIVGLIQGSIKVVRLQKPSMNLAKVGYISGLRVLPLHRRKGIGSMLVHGIEEWFIANQVDLAYMATEKNNEASVKLFINRHGYLKFRRPTILVNPSWHNFSFHAPSNIEIIQLNIEQAEFLYQEFMGSAEFFPHDIDEILKNKLSIGTWLAYYPKEQNGDEHGFDCRVLPNSWAIVSIWNSGGVFKLRLGKQPLSCFLYAKVSNLFTRVLPCFNMPTLPDFFNPFGFYFMYGVHRQGPSSGKLVWALCNFVNNLAKESKDCKVIVTEIGEHKRMKPYIAHWKCLSCSDDLWCIKALRNEAKKTVYELIKNPPTATALFVDPRDV